jgi:hypothetical protein
MMNLARSVAEVLAEHVSFELECIDRMYCNVYQPRLQHVGGVVGCVRHHLGLPVPSTVPLGAISDRFVKQVHALERIRRQLRGKLCWRRWNHRGWSPRSTEVAGTKITVTPAGSTPDRRRAAFS